MWMNIKVERAFACCINKERLFCACSDGVLRIFDTHTLKHLCTLTKPPPLGQSNIEQGTSKIDP